MFISINWLRANPLRILTIAVLSIGLLSGCASISRQELNTLGSKVDVAQVDFVELSSYGQRARAAYAPEPQIRTSYPKTVRIADVGSSGVRYFLEQDDKAKVQYLSIRGTANKKNLHEDMAYHVRDDRRAAIPVHSGFDADAVQVYTDVKPFLKKGYRLYVTGHSLGGAVASLVSIYAIEDGYKVDRVITFGQPRFTTAKGAQQLGFLPLLRVVDENDIIPMLPPAVNNKTFGPYEQVGPEVILLEGPRYVYLTSHDANRLDIGEFWRSIGIADLADHKMDNYLLRLSEKTKATVEVHYNQRKKYEVRPPAKPATKSAAIN